MKFELDQQLIIKFREKINSTNIFYEFDEYSSKWNLICAVMDRVEHTLKILNDSVKTNTGDLSHDTIIALVYVDILVKSIKELLENLGLVYTLATNSSIFNKLGICSGTDDKFFNYIRTLAFAHPVNASEHRAYIRRGETHYCPYIMDDRFIGNKGEINIRVYSSIDDSFIVIGFLPKHLINYANSRYNLLSGLTDRVDEIIQEYISRFRGIPIPIGANHSESLKNIIEAAKIRHENDLADELIDSYKSLTIPVTNPVNLTAVSEYRMFIEQSIPELLVAYQNLDNQALENCQYFKLLSLDYTGELSSYSYAISKIKTYLTLKCNRPDDVYYGYVMLKEFMQFSDRFVVIDDSIPFDEIQLLVDTSLYLYSKESKKRIHRS